MAPVKEPIKELDVKHEEKVAKFVSDVRNGKISGSDDIALAALDLMEQIILESENATAFELVCAVRAAGRSVCGALPRAPVAANVARRVLRAIRDEQRAHAEQGVCGEGESLQRLVLAAARRGTLGSAAPDLREPLRDHVAELRSELEGASGALQAQAIEHVRPTDRVLVHGGSRRVGRFVRRAGRILVVEGTDVSKSHSLAAQLSSGSRVTVVADAAVAGLMPMVDKVVLSVCESLAGGGARGRAGAGAVAAAATHYGVPVLVLSPLSKLSPRHVPSPLAAPHTAISYSGSEGELEVFSPSYDVIPPDHISLFITNLGGSSPSYIYRLMSELYDPQDHQL